MAALDVFRAVAKIADSDFLAIDVLPIVWTMSLGPLLNLQQFQQFMALIKSLSTRIEAEHMKKLQELSASNSASANRADFMSSLAPSTRANGLDDTNGDIDDFESLVLGRNKQKSNNAMDHGFDAWASAPATATARPSGSGSGTHSPAATFSWSTPPPPPPTTTATLRPPINNNVSRTVTPDQSLSSFAALQPQSAFNQTLTPSRPGMPPSQPTQWPKSSTMNSTNAWSSNATLQPSISTSNYAPTTPNYAPTTLNYSSTSLQPQQSSSNPWAIPAPQQSMNGFARPPPQSNISYGGFNIAPPPVPVQAQQQIPRQNGTAQAQAQTNGQRSGIDKYESLL